MSVIDCTNCKDQRTKVLLCMNYAKKVYEQDHPNDLNSKNYDNDAFIECKTNCETCNKEGGKSRRRMKRVKRSRSRRVKRSKSRAKGRSRSRKYK